MARMTNTTNKKLPILMTFPHQMVVFLGERTFQTFLTERFHRTGFDPAVSPRFAVRTEFLQSLPCGRKHLSRAMKCREQSNTEKNALGTK